MAGVADTSVLYAAMDETCEGHGAAVEILEGHAGIEIPPAVWCELELVVRKRAGLQVARRLLPRWLQDNRHIGVMDADLHPVAMRLWQEHGRLSAADCHAIAGALLLDAELLTLDKRQEAVWRASK